MVNSNRQVFANDLTATGTLLHRVPGIKPYNRPTSFLRSEGRVPSQLPPGRIGNTLVHSPVIAVLHVLYVQVPECDELKLVDQSPAHLVGKVLATVGDALVDVLHHAYEFAVLCRAFLARAQPLYQLQLNSYEE